MIDETGEWLECVIDNDYEINNAFPYPIRRKGSDKVIAERIDKSNGYVICALNCKKYLKHRIIAQQFIPNPINLPEIDHINHNRADNRILNLRWVSRSENQKNKTGWRHQFIYIDELPETAEPLDAYNGHEFDGLFIDYENQKLWLFNGIKYRELIGWRSDGNLYYKTYDIQDYRCCLSHKVLFG